MPEAAVYKYSEPLTTEYEIWPPGERLMSSPSGNAVCPEYTYEKQFSGPIAGGSDRGHNFRPFLSCKAISHRSSLLQPNNI